MTLEQLRTVLLLVDSVIVALFFFLYSRNLRVTFKRHRVTDILRQGSVISNTQLICIRKISYGMQILYFFPFLFSLL